MANHDRRSYEPGEESRVYDGAEDEEDVEGSRLPLLIVLALVVLAMFGGLVYLAYTQGVARGRGETPVLAAASGPARVAPQQPGGAQVPYQGFKIYEQPAPPDEDISATATPSATASDTAGGETTAPVTQPETPAVAAEKPVAAPKPEPKPGPKPEAIKPVPAKPAPVQAKPVQVKPAPVKPLAAPAPAPARPSIATAAPRSLAPAPAAASGAYFLQIGAFKSQADAQVAWKNFQARHATLVSGHGLDVQRVDLGDKGTWYRARMAGFADRDVALAMCDRLKADGGNCFLAR